ncbi:hypothetical protein RhiirA4_474517 [Rhizophagus irregularis]|uniref:Uncharacterized protein n=1 Tax=Rhizophagus irregularis TaxID=588596 RepID=A0A2I1H8M2_9GLOM|nr:hypothetical protein RhiirA4_474517 [Rhizophagus irregularis]
MGSFYNGSVYVLYKDTVFEPSSAIWHCTSFFNILSNHFIDEIPPIICIYTDGGPDHCTTYGSVQVALLCLFLKGDFDLLVAVRTAPQQSWANPAECIMSILNLGLQGVSLVRENMSDGMEKLFDKSTSNDVDAFFEQLILHYELMKQHKLHYASTTFYKILLKLHCQLRTYSFQIKKCGDSRCTICKPSRTPPSVFQSLHFLPDPLPSDIKTTNSEHYAEFDTLYGKETSDQYQPSKIETQSKCHKVQCIYSEKQLTVQQITDLQLTIETWDYTCGAPVFPENHSLHNLIFVCEKISCQTSMEFAYYSCRKSKPERYYWCGSKDDLLIRPQNLVDSYQIVYPLCNNCDDEGNDFYCRLAKKTNASKKRKC